MRSFFVGYRSSLQEVLCKRDVVTNLAKFTGKHMCKILFLIKKESGAGASCEFCEISKNNFSYRTPPVAVSAYYQKLSEEQQIFLKQSSTV